MNNGNNGSNVQNGDNGKIGEAGVGGGDETTSSSESEDDITYIKKREAFRQWNNYVKIWFKAGNCNSFWKP